MRLAPHAKQPHPLKLLAKRFLCNDMCMVYREPPHGFQRQRF